MRRFRPIGHDDRLSVVDHLDELRGRLFVCVAALLVAFGLCFWQNHRLLDVLNRALPNTPTTSGNNHISGLPADTVNERKGLESLAKSLGALAVSPTQSAGDRQAYAAAAKGAKEAAQALPDTEPKRLPITIGVGEPFATTLTVSAYFALLFSLPILIYQAYAFIIPALSRDEKRTALPLMAIAPILFVGGVAFAYVVVMPPAVHFLQGYNSENFDILVQAKSYYTFEVLTMIGIGVAFQLPLGLLALHHLGVINGHTLTKHWRYATVILAVIAAAMPGADPVTSALEAAPLVVLFVASIVLLKLADRRVRKRAEAEMAQMGEGLDLT